ncbi:MAG: dihydroorotate dehydrogenase electron transfer subunit [Deltaproteobacteria bacterium]|nr:dihydroorotate dehydrogenase electron transfer subunit [Deltaproteobacteria bacterium]
MKPIRLEAELLDARAVARQMVRLRLRVGPCAIRARPGQFVMLGPLAEGMDPFLNRPFSIHRLEGPEAWELLVAEVGRGTRMLARLEPSARLPVLGPLGSGFEPPAEGELLLVGGGAGVAPLFFLAEDQLARGRRVRLFYGASSADRLVGCEALAARGARVEICTDDGSAGFGGFVTARLEQALGDGSDWLAACGPEPMLRAVTGLARRFGLAAQVSLENRMACGTGACMGCSLLLAGGPRRVCVDGPVFDAREVF